MSKIDILLTESFLDKCTDLKNKLLTVQFDNNTQIKTEIKISNKIKKTEAGLKIYTSKGEKKAKFKQTIKDILDEIEERIISLNLYNIDPKKDKAVEFLKKEMWQSINCSLWTNLLTFYLKHGYLKRNHMNIIQRGISKKYGKRLKVDYYNPKSRYLPKGKYYACSQHLSLKDLENLQNQAVGGGKEYNFLAMSMALIPPVHNGLPVMVKRTKVSKWLKSLRSKFDGGKINKDSVFKINGNARIVGELSDCPRSYIARPGLKEVTKKWIDLQTEY